MKYRLVFLSILVGVISSPSLALSVSVTSGSIDFSLNNATLEDGVGYSRVSIARSGGDRTDSYFTPDQEPNYSLSVNQYGSSASATFDNSPASGTFDISVSNLFPSTYTMADIYLAGKYSYAGILSDFNYDYSFSSTQDFSEGYIDFVILTEFSYYDSSIRQRVYAYSDSNPSADAYRTNWVNHRAAEPDDQASGNVSFDFANYGNQNWDIRFTMRTVVYNSHMNDTPPSSPTPTPEPTTMLLFGTGLAGLAVVARRRK